VGVILTPVVALVGAAVVLGVVGRVLRCLGRRCGVAIVFSVVVVQLVVPGSTENIMDF